MIKPKVKEQQEKKNQNSPQPVRFSVSKVVIYYLLVLKGPPYPPSPSLLKCMDSQRTPPKMLDLSCLVLISELFVFPCISGYQRIFLFIFEFQPYIIIPYIKSGMHFYSKHQLSSTFHLCFDKTKVITFSYFSAWLLGLHDLHWYLSAKLKKLLCLLLGICIAVSCMTYR